jgi:hypothetical protein
MNSSASVRAILIFIAAAALALWLGVSVATDQFDTLLKVVAAAGLIICVLLGRKIWLLMVFLVAMNVPLIRGISTVDIGQALFIGFSGIIFLMRRLPLQFKFGELELWMVLIAATVVQVYLRNPVGLNIFGAGAVGGRPYFAVGAAWLTGALMSALIVPASELKWAMRLTIIGSVAGAAFTTLRMRFGGGGGGEPTGIAASTGGVGSSRVAIFGYLAPAIARVVGAFVSPVRACFHPFWAPLILVSLAFAAGSGYRNVVAIVGIYYLIAIAYRGGFFSVAIASMAAAMGLGVLALFNLARPLPANWQRALSPFPGTWEERYVQAADESTEWRVAMWKEALFTDFWIQNKLFGDGLGFTRRELEMMEAMEVGQVFESMGTGLSAQQETMMITGGYHSGPVQTIRTVGYVGLAVLMLAMIRVAVHGHREILRCRGTEWYPVALFMVIPSIALPFVFTLVFGEFKTATSQVFLAYGMITLMKRNLPLPAYVKPVRGAHILNRRAQQAGGPAALPG